MARGIPHLRRRHNHLGRGDDDIPPEQHSLKQEIYCRGEGVAHRQGEEESNC